MGIEIEQAGRRIYLRSDRPTPGLSKTVPGARWSDVKKVWSIPLSLEHCLALRDRFGAELQIGPALWAWAKAERQRRAQMGALAVAEDAPLPRVQNLAPTLYAAMGSRRYQRTGAAFIARGQNVLLGDEPGLGKTLEAIAGVIESGVPGPHLVVCPKTAVQAVWAREIPRWWPGQIVVTVPDGKAKRDAILDQLRSLHLQDVWVVVHPEMVRTRVWWVCAECGEETPRRHGKVELACLHDAKGHRNRIDHTFPQLFGQKWGWVIADESDRSLIRLSGTPTQTRQGMELLSSTARLAMSGTPFRSRPHLLWGTLNWLDSERHSAFWSWAQTYWDVEVGGYTGTAYTIGKIRDDREQRLWDALGPILLRRTKAEVAPDLPPKTYVGTPLYPADPQSPVGVWLEMDPKQARAHKSMLDTSVAALGNGTLEAVGILAEITRLKQFADCMMEADGKGGFRPALPSNKYEYLLRLLDQMGFPDDPQGKLVIASQFTAVLDLFAHRLMWNDKIPSVKLTGQVTGANRQQAIDLMNMPVGQGAHLMFLNTKAGGVAITLDTVDDMVVLDETSVPDEQTQLEDRIHRVSRPRPVRYHYLRSAGSVEEGIALVNMERRADSYRVLDARRGAEVLNRTRSL